MRKEKVSPVAIITTLVLLYLAGMAMTQNSIPQPYAGLSMIVLGLGAGRYIMGDWS